MIFLCRLRRLRHLRHLHRLLAVLLLAWLGLAQGPARAGTVLQLADRQGTVEAWPAVQMLVDADGSLTADAVQRRLAEFYPPATPTANLGPRREVVWLALAVQAMDGDGRWVFSIDYPSLNHADLYVLRNGRPVALHRMGNALPFDQRPMQTRVHAVELDLPPGVAHQLLLRVATQSAMLVPISLVKPARFHATEANEQLLQGVLAGVALALLAYSLAHWATLRDPMFLEYALLISGVTLFFVTYFGIGQQHLWNEQAGLLAKAAPLGVLVALAGGGLFIARALQTRATAPWAHRALLVIAAIATLGLMASMAGALDYRQTQTLATVLGPMPMLLAIPVAFRQARQGDRVAVYMLLGWLAYMGGALTITALLRGLLPVNFWTQHGFQFASLLEMLAWMRVLSLRIEGIRRAAERTELERAALVSLAHTDPLTGLPNRRGLQQSLAQALPLCRGESAVAVYLLDLDGFKLVNDRLGHDAGDELLVQVGQRLRRQLRHSDVVARLGGDEFVIMTTGISGEDEALVLGRKLLAAFDQPFEVHGQHCRVGLTIGFALAPHDGREAENLLKRADAAMYVGKQAGRHTVRRGGASVGLVS
jgi:diguanylate cyclase (GGDEF)-like protein